MVQILFDYTDLFAYLGRGLPVTGVQRVVHQTGLQLRELAERRRLTLTPVELAPLRSRLQIVPPARLAAFEAQCAVNRARLRPTEFLSNAIAHRMAGSAAPATASPALRARPPTWFLSLGSSWSRGGYDRIHSALGSLGGEVRIAVLVHDLIALIRPELTLKEAAAPFHRWLDRVEREAELIFVPSRATRDTIAEVRPGLEARVRVLSFGSTLSTAGRPARRHDLKGFVLYVSALRKRKNHALIVDAWARAFPGDPAAAPDLVFVGSGKADVVAELMARAPARLRPKLHILTRVDDATLMDLYDRCLFFVFPSAFEGWGLPVSEALSFGKFGLVSRNTSLTEAGGDHVEYLDHDDLEGWAAAVRRYATDAEALRARETAVRLTYRRRSWATTAEQIADVLAEASARPAAA